MSRPPNIVHSDRLSWEESQHGERYAVRRKRLGFAAGGQRLGTSLCELPPGKRAWPHHYHLGNEEAIYVLSGEGTLRLGGREIPIVAGDYVALHAGAAHAHQVINSSQSLLRYLAISTMNEPDMTVYPDSGKVGLFAGTAPGGDGQERTLAGYLPLDAAVSYWEGED